MNVQQKKSFTKKKIQPIKSKNGKSKNNTKKRIGANVSKYVVAIPTYKRYQQVFNKSISMLIKHKVPTSKIYIFVANNEERDLYKQSLDKGTYHKIVVGVLGINNQRKYITKYFKTGTNVLFIDDDVEKIEELVSGKLKEILNLDKFVRNGFKECKKNKIFLWGIYPVRNAFFMEPRPIQSFGLRFILGTFYGQIIRHDKDLLTTVQEKEDFENSILHYKKDCGVLRYEKVTLKTKFYNPDGGIMAMTNDRKQVHEKSAKKLKKLYPEYGNIWQRQNGIYEFKLKSLPYKC
jgi:cellulose synthase/poly-beta-1,6-N-acetylglucosamine synthase-like glycosyltransferase